MHGSCYTNQLNRLPLLIMGFMICIDGSLCIFVSCIIVADQVATVFFGVFYVAVMLSYIYQTRMLEDGGIVVWLDFPEFLGM